MPYDKTVHHRRSIRLSGYDYSSPDLYFITICTLDKKCIFGRIINGEMQLNKYGEIVRQKLIDIPKYCDNQVKIHEFIVMPNHIHFIIELIEPVNVGADIIRPIISVAQQPTGQVIPAPTPKAYGYSRSLSSVIRGFKAGVSKQVGHSIWQRNYYEHIIRDTADYENIRGYIFTNPQTWDADVLYQKQIEEFNERLE